MLYNTKYWYIYYIIFPCVDINVKSLYDMKKCILRNYKLLEVL